MLRITSILMTTASLVLGLAGCQYDRSFMNMDSNSGSPFFGLQFAVDSGTRPPKSTTEAESGSRSPLINRFDLNDGDSMNEEDSPLQRHRKHGSLQHGGSIDVASKNSVGRSEATGRSHGDPSLISILKPNGRVDSTSAEIVDLRLSAF